MRGRLYVSGPVEGVALQNRPAFEAARRLLSDVGYAVLVPHDLFGKMLEAPDFAHRMRRCIPAMLACDAVALLPGWDRSDGASLEARLAKVCGMRVMPAEQWVMMPGRKARRRKGARK